MALRMTDEELQIWRAAYASAFVVDFEGMRSISNYDRASLSTNAENAVYVADCSVVRLRQWRRDEQPKAGRTIQFDVTEEEREHGRVE